MSEDGVPARVRVGAAVWVAGVIQFLVAHLVVQAAWPGGYSWAGDYISDLGAVRCGVSLRPMVCSPLHGWMDLAFVLQGATLIAGLLLTDAVWQRRRGSRAWRALILLAGAGWIVVGLFPEDQDLVLHVLGAVPVFVLGNIGLVLGGRAAIPSSRLVRRSAVVLGVVGLVGLALFGLTALEPPGLGLGTTERITVHPLQVWALLTGALLLLPVPPGRRRDR